MCQSLKSLCCPPVVNHHIAPCETQEGVLHFYCDKIAFKYHLHQSAYNSKACFLGCNSFNTLYSKAYVTFKISESNMQIRVTNGKHYFIYTELYNGNVQSA